MYLNNMNNATNATQTESMDIANTIIAQINHADFWARARWGVKKAYAISFHAQGVQFECLGRIKIFIRLEPSDTYTIEIGKLKGRFNYAKLAEVSDVYADSLVRVIDSAMKEAA